MFIISECWNGRQCKLKFCWLVAVNVQVVPRIFHSLAACATIKTN